AHAAYFHAGRSRPDGACPRCVQSRRAIESRKSAAHGQGLRRNSRAADAGLRGDSHMSRPAQLSFTRLEEIVGDAHVTADTAELAAREVCGVRPVVVVSPADAAQIADILHFAGVEKLTVIPTSGCTKLNIGSPP